MGQKNNANILRLNINNNEWKSKYITQTYEESSLLVFKYLQIKTYLKQFLIRNGLMLHNYKFHINNNSIYLYISYFVGLKSIFFINQNTASQKIKLHKTRDINNRKTKKNVISSLKQSSFSKTTKYHKRNSILKKYKTNILQKNYQNTTNLRKNSFIEQLTESLNLFLGKKYNIYITFQNLNSHLIINLKPSEQKIWKKNLLLLKRYTKNKFFKETINILLLVTRCKNSAQLLSDFIAQQFTSLTRQSYFLIFFKRSLNIFVNSTFSKITGIKIIINGRFNGAPRARNNVITVGSVPIQTLNVNINYAQSTAYSSNGTFGIKVWIGEKF